MTAPSSHSGTTTSGSRAFLAIMVTFIAGIVIGASMFCSPTTITATLPVPDSPPAKQQSAEATEAPATPSPSPSLPSRRIVTKANELPFMSRPAPRPDPSRKVKWRCKPHDVTLDFTTEFIFDNETKNVQQLQQIQAWKPPKWPTCPRVRHGRNFEQESMSLKHWLSRIMCLGGIPDFAAAGSTSDSEPAVARRPLRVLQVGANTGANINDPLLKIINDPLLAPDAVLMEPVPWIYARLKSNYEGNGTTEVNAAIRNGDNIALVQAAMNAADGPVTFIAPSERTLTDPRILSSKTHSWLNQMGKIGQADAGARSRMRKGKSYFQEITVMSLSVESIVSRFAPWQAGAPPDVIVIDAEGFDSVLVRGVLKYIAQLPGDLARTAVPLIQYEHKHVLPADNDRLVEELKQAGYATSRIDYEDALAVRVGAFGVNSDEIRAKWPNCERGFDFVE